MILPVCFKTSSFPGGTTIRTQVYLWVNFQDNFWHSFDYERLLDLHTREMK